MKGTFAKQLWLSFGIIFGAMIVASVVLYFLGNDLSAQADKIIADQTMITQQTVELNLYAHLKSDAPKAAPYTAAIAQLLPSHDALIDFPAWLAGVGQTYHVSVSAAFRGGNTPATPALSGSDGFSMTATGAATDLVAFLDDIETKTQNFLLSIDTVNIVNNGSAYQLSAQGKVFSG